MGYFIQHHRLFTLDGTTPVEELDIARWARWMTLRADQCRVALDYVGVATVSTVFLGTYRAFTPGDSPALFETVVFGGPLDGCAMRYPSWADAAAGHAAMLATARAADAARSRDTT